MQFKIDLKIFLFIVLFYFTKQIEIYAMLMFFAVLHEFVPYGVAISFKWIPDDYNKKIKKGNQFEFKKILVALSRTIS